mmetsp:Transcript_310/g.369  ORF Transcript_310/g.369 Transcript_310/m.369 type:complete len:178 (+) Transcript_310:275-808(+)
MHHIFAAAICAFGMLSCCVAFTAEELRWSSYGQFSIATKIPVQIFGVKGPLVMVSALLYFLMGVLLISETGTGTVFYFCASWSVIYIDMGMEWYNSWRAMFAPTIDIIIHLTNFVVVFYSLLKLSYFPVTFILAGSGLWGVLVLMRLCVRARDRQSGTKSLKDGNRLAEERLKSIFL